MHRASGSIRAHGMGTLGLHRAIGAVTACCKCIEAFKGGWKEKSYQPAAGRSAEIWFMEQHLVSFQLLEPGFR